MLLCTLHLVYCDTIHSATLLNLSCRIFCYIVVSSYLGVKFVLQIAGKLHVEISKLGGSFMDRFANTNDDEDEDTYSNMVTPVFIRVRTTISCSLLYSDFGEGVSHLILFSCSAGFTLSD